MWGIAMIYISMLYMRDWIVALWSYIVTYSFVLTLLLYYYTPTFMLGGPASAFLDVSYYVLLMVWTSCCSVMAVRAYELYERRRYFSMQQQAREVREWKRLMEDLPEPVVFSHRGAINFFNSATLELLGVKEAVQDKTPEETRSIIAENLGKIRRKEKDMSLADIILGAVDLGQETAFVYRRESESKVNLMIKCMKTSEQTEDCITGFIFHDVTAFKKLQKNKTKEQCFDVLLATASHDIRTPLNVMLGVLDVLDEYMTNEESREQLKVARNCGQRMVHYLKGLSLIRQINTSCLDLKKHKFCPIELAAKVIDTIEFSAQTKRLALKTSFDPALPDRICSDEEMYMVVLQNLLENALKYTFEGSISISLSYDPVSSLLSTEVCDTGIGMTPEQMRTAGALFKKVTCELNPQGLGLGLFLAKTLSLKLGGELHIKSEEGRGTRVGFTVRTCPLSEAVPNRLASLDTSAQSLQSHEGSKPILLSAINCASTDMTSAMSPTIATGETCDCPKVLLVDDEPLNLVVLMGYLRQFKLKIDKAENGRMAIDLIEERAKRKCCHGYRVVFMDINMPVMDGVQATNIIRDYAKEGKIGRCNVVAVTAAAKLDQPEVYDRYISEGFTELRTLLVQHNRVLVSKPVPKKAFVGVLGKYISLPS